MGQNIIHIVAFTSQLNSFTCRVSRFNMAKLYVPHLSGLQIRSVPRPQGEPCQIHMVVLCSYAAVKFGTKRY
jgi:hypothetical protein